MQYPILGVLMMIGFYYWFKTKKRLYLALVMLCAFSMNIEVSILAVIATLMWTSILGMSNKSGMHKRILLMKKFKGLMTSLSCDWATPTWLYEELDKEFHFQLDPCPLRADFNGLDIPWFDYTYVNPPYSSPLKWIEKAIEESKKGKIIAMLLRVDTSTKWFARLHEADAKILWLNGRIRYRRNDYTYDKPTPANFASMLVVLGGEELI